MDNIGNITFNIRFWNYLALVFHLISLGVLLFWFMKSKKRALDGILFSVGILLHLYALFFTFGFILKLDIIKYLYTKVIFVPGSQWTRWHFHIFLILDCFRVWLGLTLILKHRELQWKRFLGVLPILSVLMLLLEPFIFGYTFGYLLLLPILVAATMIIFHIYSRKSTTFLKALEKSESGREQLKEIELEPVQSIRRSAEKSLPCRKAVVTLNSSDIPKLKEQGPDFSAKLLGKVIGFKDRIVFQGLLIAVTHLEPVGPAVITSETKIKIRSTEDQVILHCPHCGEIQKEIQMNCSSCNLELPVKVL